MTPEQAAIDRGDDWTAEQERRRRLDQQGGTSWLDDLARNSLAAAEAKFGREPADELRAAAARLRELAAKATPGPWTRRTRTDSDGVVAGVFAPDSMLVAFLPTDGGAPSHDADWIAAMNPGIAEPLAAWLDDEADTAEELGAEVAEYHSRNALALARAIRSTP